MTLSELAARLDNAQDKMYKGNPGHVARCPSCALQGKDEKGHHLLVWETPDEWLHVNCIKECAESAILSALGMSDEDRRVKPYQPLTNEAQLPVYVYEGPNGYVAEKHRRIDKANGKKFCHWKVRFKNGVPLQKVEQTVKSGPNKGRKYTDYPTPDQAGLNGEVDVLYRFPQLRKAIEKGKTIYIGEGEPASETAWKQGIMHTCQRAGAGSGKWLPIYTAQLKGAKKIVIVADLDPEGETYAREVFTLLRAAGFDASVVRSKTTREHDDFRDHLEAGYTEAELRTAPDLMPPRGLSVVTSNSKPDFVRPTYLVDRYLPEGKLVLFDADGKVGKTSLAVAWAASLSLGLHPVRHTPLPQGPVKTLYLHHGEDSNAEVETVYYANGGREGYLIQPVEDIQRCLRFDRSGLELVRETVIDNQCGLAVVDALLYFLTGVLSNINDALPIMPILEHMTEISRSTRCTFLDIRHTTKGVVGKDAGELGMGSVAFRNSHRGQLVARYHPTEKGLVIVEDRGGSLLIERDDTFAYRRVGDFGEIQYVEAFDNPFDPKERVGDAKSKSEMCERWLEANLTGQFVKSDVVYSTLLGMGASRRTIDGVCSRLKVKYEKLSDGSYLRYIETIAGRPDPFAE